MICTDSWLKFVFEYFDSYWGRDHRYETDVMSIRHGGLIPRQEPFQKSGNKLTLPRSADSRDLSVLGEDLAETKITAEFAITERATIAAETEGPSYSIPNSMTRVDEQVPLGQTSSLL